MLRKFVRAQLEHRAKARLARCCDAQIAPSAKVSYRQLIVSPPSRLIIGEGAIFEGHISADRNGCLVSIGANSFVGGSRLVCAERIEIGDDVLVSWGCTIVDHHSHALAWSGRKNDVREWYAGRKSWEGVKIAPVIIRDRAWIGFNAIILAGVTIGEGAVVGGGSVVTRDVPPMTIVAGNPARPVREITVD